MHLPPGNLLPVPHIVFINKLDLWSSLVTGTYHCVYQQINAPAFHVGVSY